MSNATMEQRTADPRGLQTRIHALGRQALEGARPLSDLLGEALAELRSTLETVRGMESEISSLRGALEQERRRPRLEPVSGGDSAAAAPSADGAGRADGSGAGAEPRVPQAPASLAAEEPPHPNVDLFERPVPDGPAGLEASLRARIAGALYLGTLGEGDRLPSIRELARRTGLNHKVVRRVYRSLEDGGSVEVRDRSGIYVTGSDGAPDGLDPMQAWVAEIVAESVRLGVGAPELPRLLERSVGARRLRCACVESTEDDRFALCREVGGRFGLETLPVPTDGGPMRADLRDADLVVTTPFHAEEVRRALGPAQPLVVACLHPRWWQAVEPRADGEPVRLLCVERAAGERLRHSFGPDVARRLQVVTVGGAAGDGDGSGGRSAAGVATLAAWSRIGRGDPPASLRVPPYLSSRTASRLAKLVVRLNGAVPAA